MRATQHAPYCSTVDKERLSSSAHRGTVAGQAKGLRLYINCEFVQTRTAEFLYCVIMTMVRCSIVAGPGPMRFG